MVHGEQSRTPWWLIALLFTVFVLYTDDYVIAGILPELAHDMGVTAATAGQLVSAFSLTIVIGAPLAALTLVRVPRKTLFVCSLTVFCLANIGAWAAPSYPLLLACRVLAATGTAAATPAVFAFTAGHAPAHKTGKYLAIIAIGSTGSIAAGVPLGT